MLPNEQTPETLETNELEEAPIANDPTASPHTEPLAEAEVVLEAPAAQDDPGADDAEQPSAEAPDAPAPEAPEEEQQTEGEAPNWEDRFLRLAAEYENYRKRTQREKEALIHSTAEQVVVALLPTLDDLERALKAAETSDNLEKLKEGVALAHKKLLGALSRQGVEAVPALGEAFDPELHESIASLPVEDDEKKGKVIDEVERGYRLRGKVIRFAKVAVGD